MTEKKKPWLKWYPSDWRAEPRLRLCSRAARSLWLDMLGLMHESTLIGYLLINGKKPTPQQLAQVLGDDIQDLSRWLDELAAAGVYSETDDGVVYSRRMVRDHERAEKGRKDVEKRWGSKRKSSENADRPPNTDPNRVPNRAPSDDPITQRPEARGQKEVKAKQAFTSSGPGSAAGVRKAPAASPVPDQKAIAASLIEHAPDWGDREPTWSEVKRMMPVREWSVWFGRCSPTDSPRTIIADSAFAASEIQKRYGQKLERHFGAPVRVLFGQQPHEVRQ